MSAAKERDALRFANLLFDAARDAGVEHPVFEIRTFEFVEDPGYKHGGTNSGYFDAPERLAKAALSLEGRKARAVYVTLNPCDPSLLARAKNRIRPRARTTTSDQDIVRRLWLLVDVDPERPSGISSTTDQCRQAIELVRRIQGELSLIDGWPEPIIACSGNGGHLLYRVDLPNDEGSKILVKRSLEALARRFGTDSMKVDTTVHNAARISKVYGTTARKGDPLNDRPHRLARLEEVPDRMEVVSREQLERIVADAQTAPKSPPAPPGQTRSSAGASHNGLLEEFIARHGLSVASRKRGERDQDVLVLEVCPFNSDHARDGGGGGSAVLTREADGKLGFKCHHNGCAENDWKALRALLEPERVREAGGASDGTVPLGGRLTAQTAWEGRRVVVTLCDEERAVHVDRVDPVSAKSREMLLGRLATACTDLDDDGCKALERHLVDQAASGPPSSASDPDAPTVVDPDPEPWDEEVDGAALLDELAEVLGRYLVLPDHAAETIALWVVHTYAHAAFRYTPRLLLTSPDKRCGKSRLLGVIRAVVSRPLAVEGVTAAAMFRVIDAHKPTLLLDEADTYLRGRDMSEELRGVVNAGHARGGRVLRCVGDDHEPTPFSVFAPVVLAMIGRPPGTIEDRSIVVPMRRRTAAEPIARLRPGTSLRDDLEHLRRRCRRWVDDLDDDLAESDPQIPQELDDRAADHWLPLLALADAAGGPWSDRARAAAVAMTRARAEGDADSAGVLLLGDLRDVFEGGRIERLATTNILVELRRMEERPWPGFGRAERPITAQQMAQLLRPFGVRPKNLRIEGEVVKGYRAADLSEAWSRYTPAAEPLHATDTTQLLGEQRCSDVAGGERNADTPPHVAGSGACATGSGGASQEPPPPGSSPVEASGAGRTDAGPGGDDGGGGTAEGQVKPECPQDLETRVVELLRHKPRSPTEIRDALHQSVSVSQVTEILRMLRLIGEVDCQSETTGAAGGPREVWFLYGHAETTAAASEHRHRRHGRRRS